MQASIRQRRNRAYACVEVLRNRSFGYSVCAYSGLGQFCGIVFNRTVVGGFIGGAVSALFSMFNVMLIKSIKNVWLKIAVTIGMTALTFLACYLIALAFLSAMMN